MNSKGNSVIKSLYLYLYQPKISSIQLLQNNPLCTCSSMIPESPRWLLARGRNSDAVAVIRMLGRRNGKPLPASVTTFMMVKQNDDRHGNSCDILKSKTLRPRFFIMAFHWYVSRLLLVISVTHNTKLWAK